MTVSNNVSEMIGRTPLVKINHISRDGAAQVFAKVESTNPGGSIKDRICLAMIDVAEKGGLLKAGGMIVEPTSGNTGIGLAMIGAARGYKVILTMPETMSLERIYILKAYGAEVILTPGVEGMSGAIKKAVATEEHKKRMADMGLTIRYMDPSQYAKYWGEYETMLKELLPLTKE